MRPVRSFGETCPPGYASQPAPYSRIGLSLQRQFPQRPSRGAD